MIIVSPSAGIQRLMGNVYGPRSLFSVPSISPVFSRWQHHLSPLEEPLPHGVPPRPLLNLPFCCLLALYSPKLRVVGKVKESPFLTSSQPASSPPLNNARPPSPLSQDSAQPHRPPVYEGHTNVPCQFSISVFVLVAL